jgi:lipid-binding SYLF domain-containing protein
MTRKIAPALATSPPVGRDAPARSSAALVVAPIASRSKARGLPGFRAMNDI